MGRIVCAGIAPHPPIMIPEVGQGEESKVESTIEAMDKLAHSFKEAGPNLIVIISPHGAVFSDGVAINGIERLRGNLSAFRAPKVVLEYENDLAFVEILVTQSKAHGVTALAMEPYMAQNYGISLDLDHGVTVPMYFLDKAGIRLPLVMVSMSMLPPIELYTFGMALKKAAEVSGRKVALIASADLSHRLTPEAPTGYAPEGKLLDEKLVQYVKNFDVQGLLNLDPELAEKGGECGWRSILMMLGALEGCKVNTEVLSYEGPFGVGYMVATLFPVAKNIEGGLIEKLRSERDEKIKSRRQQESEYVRLAREALEQYVEQGERPEPPSQLPDVFKERAGVFVSIKKNGQLRGCIGTIQPTTGNLAQEIINNAISAGTEDPRFAPVQAEELIDLVYSVDILSRPEPVSDMSELDPQRYGVIVRNGRRTGLLLPNLEGIDTVEEQVAIARQKAGIEPQESIELERFEVVRHH